MFAPMLGFPGIVMSALNSFNTIYGVLHSGTVSVIKEIPFACLAHKKPCNAPERPALSQESCCRAAHTS